MGIPKFFGRWVAQKIPNALYPRLPGRISSVMVDFNSSLHELASIIYSYGDYKNPERTAQIQLNPEKTEEEYMLVIQNEILSIVKKFLPLDNFVLAVDGVAPQAKIVQQRARRFLASKSGTQTIFDSNSITPGTDLMIKIDQVIVKSLNQMRLELPQQTIYTSHLVPGEGEHKIMDFIRKGMIRGNDAHVIYGLDADLIILSLLAPIENLWLYRDEREGKPGGKGRINILSIDAFKTEIIRLMGGIIPGETGLTTPVIDFRQYSEFENEESINLPLNEKIGLYNYNKLVDFSLLMSLVGNDFLPHQPSMEDINTSIDSLLEVYHRFNSLFSSRGEIKLPNFFRYLTLLAQEEPQWMNYLSGISCDYVPGQKPLPGRIFTSEILKLAKIDFKLFREAWNKQLISTSSLVSFSSIEKDLPAAIQAYLDGINWILHYYTRGTSFIDNQWFYPYHYTPLLTDFAELLGNGKVKGISPKNIESSNLNFPTIFQQLLSVMPLRSKELLPIEIRHLADKTSIIREYYPDNIILDVGCKSEDWMAIPLIPFVNPIIIKQAINTYSIPMNQYRKNLYALDKPRNNLIITRNPYEEVAQASQRRLDDIADQLKKREKKREFNPSIISAQPQIQTQSQEIPPDFPIISSDQISDQISDQRSHQLSPRRGRGDTRGRGRGDMRGRGRGDMRGRGRGYQPLLPTPSVKGKWDNPIQF